MNVQLLKSKMVLHGDKQEDLARVLGIEKNTIRHKLYQKNDFKQSEIKLIAERYNLTADEIKKIFFS